MLFVIAAALLAVAGIAIHSNWPYLLTLLQPAEEAVSEDRAPSLTPKERPWGVWDPQTFAYPAVPKLDNFDIDGTKPIPFRPFRWGPNYPINMSIRPMPWKDWIHLDSDYRKTHKIRLKATTEKGEEATRTLPGYHAHALEVLLELASFLSIRYPEQFTVDRYQYCAEKEETHGDSFVGAKGGAVKVIHNLITGEVWDLAEIERHEGPQWNPMRIAGLLTMDDLACMVEGTNGEYYFQAGSICTPGFWRLKDKIGTSLEDIHRTGSVPGWKEKLKFSMERFFQKMKVDKPVERNNYFFQIDDQLSWSQKTNGPEPIWDHTNKGPKPELLKVSADPTWTAPAPTDDINDVWFRTERQSLRRLPKTGAILFTIRTYFYKVTDFANEPGVPGRMASAIRSWPDKVDHYKGGELYRPILLPYLDKLHDAQLAAGTVVLGEEQEDLDGSKYPL